MLNVELKRAWRQGGGFSGEGRVLGGAGRVRGGEGRRAALKLYSKGSVRFRGGRCLCDPHWVPLKNANPWVLCTFGGRGRLLHPLTPPPLILNIGVVAVT